MDAHRGQKDVSLGEYRGFPLIFEELPFFGEQELVVRGKLTYRFSLGNDPQGNTIRLDNALGNIMKHFDQSRASLADLKQQLEDIKTQIGKPFPQAEELAEKEKRLVELTAKLRDDQQPTEIADNTPAAQPPPCEHRRSLGRER